MLKKFLLICFALIVFETSSARHLMTPYEAPLSINKEDFVLTTADPTQAEVVILRNISGSALWLNRVLVENPGVSAGWSSELDAKRWSALSWQGSFTLSCQQRIDQIIQPVSCTKVLRLYKPLALKKIAKGSYWIVENKTKTVMMSALFKAMLF